MGKRFLDRIEDALGAETLTDVIPHRIQPPPAKKARHNQGKGVSKRKKRFLESIDENLGKTPTPPKKSGRKSFLDAIEEALEDQAFDDLFPAKTRSTPKKAASSTEPDYSKSRFSLLITTEVLDRARQIADAKGIRIADVINIALKRYVEEK